MLDICPLLPLKVETNSFRLPEGYHCKFEYFRSISCTYAQIKHQLETCIPVNVVEKNTITDTVYCRKPLVRSLALPWLLF